MASPPQSGPLDPARIRDAGEMLSAALPPLLVEAERVAVTLAPGVHGRRRSGPGESFWQYRHYSDGDPATAVDWRQSARTDHLYVRENEWEAAHDVLLWRDASASMDYASEDAPCTKAHRAAVLVLALGSLLVRAGERIGPLDGAFPAGATRTTLRRLADHIGLASTGDLSAVPPAPRLKRFTRIVLVSDFLLDLDQLGDRIRGFGGAGTKGHLVQVMDPAEETLPFTGRTLFQDVEGDARFLAGRAESLREDYADRLAAHRARLEEIAGAWGWTLTVHGTDEPPAAPLLTLYDLIAGARR